MIDNGLRFGMMSAVRTLLNRNALVLHPYESLCMSTELKSLAYCGSCTEVQK